MSAVPVAEGVWLVGTAEDGPARTSPYDSHCYLVCDGETGLLIDSGTGLASAQWLANVAEVCEPHRLAGVVLTHYHADHAGGAASAQRAGLPLFASATTAETLAIADEETTQVAPARRAGVYPADYRLAAVTVVQTVTDGTIVRAGDVSARIIDAPGHCDGNIALLIRIGHGPRWLFSSDTVFTGGRVSLQPLPDCRPAAYAHTLTRLAAEQIDGLFPGHGQIAAHDGARHVLTAATHVRDMIMPPNLFHNGEPDGNAKSAQGLTKNERRGRISETARSYPASSIRQFFTLAREHPDPWNLTVGEPDFDTPEHIKRAAIEAIEHGETRYVANGGLPELREAIAEQYTRRWGQQLSADNVMVTFGGMEALMLALDVTVEAGDDVLVVDPGYPNYRGQIHRLGARVVPLPVHAAHGFKLRAADIAAAVTDRTSVLILNSPSNPLGSVIDRDDLVEITRMADQHGFMIVSDEVYEEIVFDGETHVSVAQVRSDFDRYLVINSLSKSYAMTGWRCGFVIGPADLVAPMPIMQEGTASCVQPFVQRAAIAALTGPQDAARAMVKSYEQRRDLIVARLNAIDGIHCLTPEATFYIFVNMSAFGMSSWGLAVDLLKEQNLAVVPGSAFGDQGEGYLRLTFAVSPTMIEFACDGLANYVQSRS